MDVIDPNVAGLMIQVVWTVVLLGLDVAGSICLYEILRRLPHYTDVGARSYARASSIFIGLPMAGYIVLPWLFFRDTQLCEATLYMSSGFVLCYYLICMGLCLEVVSRDKNARPKLDKPCD